MTEIQSSDLVVVLSSDKQCWHSNYAVSQRSAGVSRNHSVKPVYNDVKGGSQKLLELRKLKQKARCDR